MTGTLCENTQGQVFIDHWIHNPKNQLARIMGAPLHAGQAGSFGNLNYLANGFH